MMLPVIEAFVKLRKVIERAVLLCGATIDLEHLLLEITLTAESGAENESRAATSTAPAAAAERGIALKDAR